MLALPLDYQSVLSDLTSKRRVYDETIQALEAVIKDMDGLSGFSNQAVRPPSNQNHRKRFIRGFRPGFQGAGAWCNTRPLRVSRMRVEITTRKASIGIGACATPSPHQWTRVPG
jgi:hypothetical protein